ncbi:FeoA family protein [Petrotoga halophila]|uniref:Ferrous iron transporter FeoA-like domain-containing protein n=1 Tax=Petrotoga halophila DSM 16923 TaxID=1122953 RepID=A0A2S5EJV6_9BACT|nr:FeoA family protein [Petrotoga halophila]POZ93426.1 hypothetical protein AA81_01770 [Petrotoga halophila DSM 16923]
MYLIELHNGDKAIVKRINGGTNLTRRLLQMGVIPGVEIKVIRNNKYGPMILEIFGNKVMIGRGMASAIEVG